MEHLDNCCSVIKAEIIKIKEAQEKEKNKQAEGKGHKAATLHSTTSEDPETSHNEFHRFSRLPFELREAIWEYALQDCESRIFEVELDDFFRRVSRVTQARLLLDSLCLMY